jgi:hypothetical protein
VRLYIILVTLHVQCGQHKTKKLCGWILCCKGLSYEISYFNWTVNAHKRTPLQVHFIYSGNKEICGIFKKCCVTSVFPPQNAVYFIILSFLCSRNTFYINHALNCKYQPGLSYTLFTLLVITHQWDPEVYHLIPHTLLARVQVQQQYAEMPDCIHAHVPDMVHKKVMDKFKNMFLMEYNSLHSSQQRPHTPSGIIWHQTSEHHLHSDITKLINLKIKMGHF